jgi:hypothetical protein
LPRRDQASAAPSGKPVADLLVSAACDIPTNVGPKLAPSAAANFITAYEGATETLVKSGWVTQTQATDLDNLADQVT